MWVKPFFADPHYISQSVVYQASCLLFELYQVMRSYTVLNGNMAQIWHKVGGSHPHVPLRLIYLVSSANTKKNLPYRTVAIGFDYNF